MPQPDSPSLPFFFPTSAPSELEHKIRGGGGCLRAGLPLRHRATKKKKRKRVGGNGQLLANSAEALMALIFLTQKRLASQLKTIIVHCLSTM